MFGMVPKQKEFFEMLERAADNVSQGAEALSSLINDFTDVETKAKRVKEIEHEGDIISHEVFDALNKSFITPIDREDIHSLASVLDDILDAIERVTSRMVLYRVESVHPSAKELVAVLVDCTRQVRKTIGCLRDVGQTTRILDHCIEIDRLENVADDLLHSALATLFDEPESPIEVIKWKEILETIEYATDACEDASDVIETIVVKGT